MHNIAYTRSEGIFNPDLAKPVNIIGCGSIGSYVAETLAKMGFQKFYLYDGDTVGEENIGCQNYGWQDIGRLKVDALKDILIARTPVLAENIITIPEYVTLRTPIKRLITFVGVDSMAARKNLWILLKGKIPLLIDGRIGGETIRVFTVRPVDEDMEFYNSTLYSDAEADDLPCTQRNVADVALFVAAMMVNSIRRYLTKEHSITEMGMFTQSYTTYTM